MRQQRRQHGAADQKDSVEQVQEGKGCRKERHHKQEDKRCLVALAYEATHTALAEIMRLSQEEEDLEVVLFG